MQRPSSLFTGLLLLSAAGAQSLPGLSAPNAGAASPPRNAILPSLSPKSPITRDFGRLPLSFESNQGQTNGQVRFLTHNGDSALFLTPTEAVFAMPAQPLRRSRMQTSLHPGTKARRAAETSARVALRMQMVGANSSASVVQQQPLPGRVNYFIGKDPSKWHAGVPTFGRVGFHQVYPGVDLVYYGNQRHLEYDFVVAPHADPRQITLHFAGAQGVRVNTAGDLVVRTAGRELKWQKPTVYQQDKTGKHAVAARFRLKRLPNGQAGVSFALGRYDASRPVVIDPVLLYSTFLGGSGAFGDYANAIAIDNSGNAYITGSAFSTDFPTTAGAFQRIQKAGAFAANAFVTKLNSTGTALVYSTFVGGSGSNGEQSSAIAVDSNGNAYITGATHSTDYPVTSGAFQQTKHGGANTANAFVTKLNPTGTALVYSTYLGGNAETNPTSGGGIGIAVDSLGYAFVAGTVYSTDFPTTPGAFQPTKSAPSSASNAFVTKLNPTGTALIYSSFIGGSVNPGDGASGIAIDGNDAAYVAGYASSADFPTTASAYQRAKSGPATSTNAFVTMVNPTGTALVYSTFLGGSAASPGDRANGIAVDPTTGNAYVTGYALSTDFPITSGAFQQAPKAGVNAGNAFVTKLNPAGTALVYSTYLGGNDYDAGRSIAIDVSGNAYVTGYTFSADFPATLGTFQRVKRSTTTHSDSFVTKLNSTGTALIYSTFLGTSASNQDAGSDIVVDNSGHAYIAGRTYASDFPVTAGAFQRTYSANTGYPIAYVTKLFPIPIFPDFNNDGNTDLLIQNASTNVIASWFMQGATWISGAYFSLTPPAEYALVGVGDFSGAGNTALVLQSRSSNQIAFWYANGTNSATISGGDYVSINPLAGWKVVGVGDFNGDGKSDLVFQNQSSNQVSIWFMNGPTYQGGVLLPFTPPVGWTVAGVGDFNADGFPDLVFQNQSTGQLALWYMNGTTYMGGTVLTTVPGAGWKVVGVGDYNGDGYADLLFQNQTSNQAAVWYLKNSTFAGGDTLSLAPPSGWKIVGPR
ncbi:MAG: hypothetical protein JWL77_1074 [Chthonomonadaceae bacterium]|nr:hypothetical protein [Chthonomonadaceae bacterium]